MAKILGPAQMRLGVRPSGRPAQRQRAERRLARPQRDRDLRPETDSLEDLRVLRIRARDGADDLRAHARVERRLAGSHHLGGAVCHVLIERDPGVDALDIRLDRRVAMRHCTRHAAVVGEHVNERPVRGVRHDQADGVRQRGRSAEPLRHDDADA
jgi:hypothetical protein